MRTAQYRLVEWKVPGKDPSTAIYELYDYEVDSGENKNLAKDKPEVVQQLAAILAKQPEAKPQIHVENMNEKPVKKRHANNNRNRGS